MKWSSLVLLFVLFVLANDLLGQHGLSKFAGNWLRDDIVVANKQHLPRVIWSITIDDETLVLVELSEQQETLRRTTYNLDGSETHSVTHGSPARRSTYKFTWNRSQGKIGIREELIVSGMPNVPPQKYEVKQMWELTNGGKTLKVAVQIRSAKPEILGFELFNSKDTFQKVQSNVRD